MPTSDFEATTTNDPIPAQWYIEIEGLRIRYGTAEPSWNPADSGTNQHIEPYVHDLPEIQGQSVEPLDGSTEYQSFSIDLVDVGDELTELFSIHDTTNRNETTLGANITAAGTTLTVADSSVFSTPCDIYVERETMRATAAPTGTTLTVTRGMYGSTAVIHEITDVHGNTLEVKVTDKPTFFITREIVLSENRSGLVEADSIHMRCFIEEVTENNGLWRISAAGFLRLLDKKIGTTLASTKSEARIWGGLREDQPTDEISICTWRILCTDNSEFESTGHILIDNEVMEYVEKPASTQFDLLDDTGTGWEVSKRVHSFESRGLFSTEIYGAAGTIWGNPPDPSVPWMSQPILMEPHAAGTEIREVIHSDKFTQGTDPASVILTFLISEGGGGTYDILPEGWGAGIPQAKVDITGIQNLCARVGLDTLDLAPFCITEEVNLREWLVENILRPCGIFFVEDADGKISMSKLWTEAEARLYTTAETLDESVMNQPPEFSLGRPPIGNIKISVNWNPGTDDFMGVINCRLADADRRYGELAETYEIECKTIYDSRASGRHPWNGVGGKGRLTIQSSDHGEACALLGVFLGPIWSRYAVSPCPIVTVEVPYNRYIDFLPGQTVQITSTATPDLEASARGLSGEYFQVVESAPDPRSSSVRLTLWEIDVHDEDYRMLAPAAKVSGYAAAGGADGKPRVSLYDSIFADGIKYTYDSEAFNEDDDIMFVDAEYIALSGAGVPENGQVYGSPGTGVGTCYIDLVDVPTDPPGDGDYIITSKYTSAVASQKSAWAFLADSSDGLGATPDDGHKRQ